MQPILDRGDVQRGSSVSRSSAPARRRRATHVNKTSLAGKLFDETGDRLTPSHANRKGIRYRYYVSNG